MQIKLTMNRGCIALLLMLAATAGANENMKWDNMIELTEAVREAEQRLRKIDKDEELRETSKEIISTMVDDEWREQVSKSAGKTFFRFWEARLYRLAGREESALQLSKELVAERSVAPEIGKVLLVNVANRKELLKYHLQFGRLLPVSDYGLTRNLDNGPSIRGGEDVRIPDLRKSRNGRKNLIEIAELSERVRSPRHVRNAWLEAIYGGYNFISFRSSIGEWDGWLAEETGDMWLRVGELEFWLSGPEEAADYLAKAMVCGSEENFRQGKELIEKWRPGDLEPPPDEKPREDIEAQDILRMVELYSDLNVHPRAFALLRDYEDVLGEEKSSELYQKYMDQWLEKVETFGRWFESYLLFGQPADTEKQRREIEVPPVLDEKEVKEVAANLRELIAEKKEK